MWTPIGRFRNEIAFRRLWQFGAVGAVGAAFDTAILIALVELAGLGPVPAKVLSAEFSILVMFAINETWTFSDWGADSLRSVARRLLTSNFVRLGGIAVATAILAALTSWYGVSYVLANGAGIGAGFIVNYAMENLLTWRTHR